MQLNFPQPIFYGSERLHTAPSPPHQHPTHQPGLAIGALNIQDDRVFGVWQAIWVVERWGVDVMVLKETNIQSEA